MYEGTQRYVDPIIGGTRRSGEKRASRRCSTHLPDINLRFRQWTRTNQYLSFRSHHLLKYKLGVIHTLCDQCYSIITEEADVVAEINHVDKSLEVWAPEVAFRKVRQGLSH